jgi:hypothetical protein
MRKRTQQIIQLLVTPVKIGWNELSEWRQRHLLTRKEAESLATAAHSIGYDTARQKAEQKLGDAIKSYQNQFLELVKIEVDTDGRRQVMDIRLVLDRRVLKVVDVEDAANLIAARTAVIYKEALEKRMKENQ